MRPSMFYGIRVLPLGVGEDAPAELAGIFVVYAQGEAQDVLVLDMRDDGCETRITYASPLEEAAVLAAIRNHV